MAERTTTVLLSLCPITGLATTCEVVKSFLTVRAVADSVASLAMQFTDTDTLDSKPTDSDAHGSGSAQRSSVEDTTVAETRLLSMTQHIPFTKFVPITDRCGVSCVTCSGNTLKAVGASNMHQSFDLHQLLNFHVLHLLNHSKPDNFLHIMRVYVRHIEEKQYRLQLKIFYYQFDLIKEYLNDFLKF